MKIGDFVRDRAGLGGRIVTMWFEWAGVEWNNGNSGWIKLCWLKKDSVGPMS